jgi:hypothetical protein
MGRLRLRASEPSLTRPVTVPGPAKQLDSAEPRREARASRGPLDFKLNPESRIQISLKLEISTTATRMPRRRGSLP